MTMTKVAEVKAAFGSADALASEIARLFHKWKTARREWEQEKRELQEYIFAVDTTKTANKNLPWSNTTTIPKLCQIRDNLFANYYSALFPNDEWLEWFAGSDDESLAQKAKAIKAYILTKTRNNDFKNTVSLLLYDYIDGNCFADTEYVNITNEDAEGNITTSYVGPRIVRIDPSRIVFDITAPSFEEAPKIVQHIMSMGDLESIVRKFPTSKDWAEAALDKMKRDRAYVASTGVSDADLDAALGLQNQGFGNLSEYYSSGYIEVLEFEGDIYDTVAQEFKSNRRIFVIDRRYVLIDAPIRTWTGKSTKKHCGWRLRPGNLMAMGPLDNIVGMQYRIDHLENLKADAFDMIAHPMIKTIGDVSDFDYVPGGRIDVGIDGDVTFMNPDTTSLQANLEIQLLEDKMEEMAGAPKHAMGFRTPGEKTKFEVQQLVSAAVRVFQNKITNFEESFFEPLLNSMLEVARRNITGTDVVMSMDDDLGVQEFLSVSRKDITATGTLKPMGARHFAERSIAVQELSTFLASPAASNPLIAPHLSGKAAAKAFSDLLGLDKYGIYKPNVAIFEQAETTRLANAAKERLAAEQGTPGQQEEEAERQLAEQQA